MGRSGRKDRIAMAQRQDPPLALAPQCGQEIIAEVSLGIPRYGKTQLCQAILKPGIDGINPSLVVAS